MKLGPQTACYLLQATHREAGAEPGLESRPHTRGPTLDQSVHHWQWVEVKMLTGVNVLRDQGAGETALVDKTNLRQRRKALLSRQLFSIHLCSEGFFLAWG